jgi:hypothetical protein
MQCVATKRTTVVMRHLSHEPLNVSRKMDLRLPSVSDQAVVASKPRNKTDLTSNPTLGKVHRRDSGTEIVAQTYPLRIGVLCFQVNEQLLRVPIKQSRKVCDPGIESHQALDRGSGGNDKGLIKTLKGDECSRERTSSYIKCNKGIFLPTVRISSRLACEPVMIECQNGILRASNKGTVKIDHR